jgi:hypothetical protein
MTAMPTHASAPVAAAAYAARGWHVLPLHTPTAAGGCSCGHADCPKPGKHPRARHGVRDASTAPARIQEWWRRWPLANIGVATGALVVIDVDGPAGERALATLERRHAPLPRTLTVLTARGRHLYLAAGGYRIGNSAGQLGTGIDVRGHGGYAITPPSRHSTGHLYRWAGPDRIAALPDWLAELLSASIAQRRDPPPAAPVARRGSRAERYAQSALAGESRAVATAPRGTRNDTLNRSAFRLGQLAAAGLAAPEELATSLLVAARAAGLPDTEAVATIASGLRAGQQRPRRRAESA